MWRLSPPVIAAGVASPQAGTHLEHERVGNVVLVQAKVVIPPGIKCDPAQCIAGGVTFAQQNGVRQSILNGRKGLRSGPKAVVSAPPGMPVSQVVRATPVAID